MRFLLLCAVVLLASPVFAEEAQKAQEEAVSVAPAQVRQAAPAKKSAAKHKKAQKAKAAKAAAAPAAATH